MHPNAGLPDASGEYTQTAEQMADIVREYAESGWLNIIGGCCGTTPQHMSAIAEVVADFAPREYSGPESTQAGDVMKLSGLGPLKLRPDSLFVNVG